MLPGNDVLWLVAVALTLVPLLLLLAPPKNPSFSHHFISIYT